MYTLTEEAIEQAWDMWHPSLPRNGNKVAAIKHIRQVSAHHHPDGTVDFPSLRDTKDFVESGYNLAKFGHVFQREDPQWYASQIIKKLDEILELREKLKALQGE